MSGRLAVAALLGAAVLLAIALIGGGWFSLGRVDPLLALPGAGWAAGVAVALARGDRRAIPAMLLAGAAVLLGACLHAGATPPVLPLAVTLFGMGAALVLARAMLRLPGRLAHGRRHLRMGVALALVALLGIVWQMLAWQVVPRLYATHGGVGPRVTMLSALPLTSGDDVAAQLAGRVERAPILDLLRRYVALTRVDDVDARTLAGTDVLLLAHPRALSPAALVAIDRWVRDGGRAVVLADGLSSWPPAHPLGDPRNPPVSSLLTPLLSHWGLRLDAPSHPHGDAAVMRGRQRLHLASAGRFVRLHPGGPCAAEQAFARCRIGRGQVLLLADADLLHESLWQGRAGRGAASWTSANAQWLLAAIFRLADSPAPTAFASPSWVVAPPSADD